MVLGHGLLNTLVGLRAAHEAYSDVVIGILTSCYYVGFILGTVVAMRWISKVGHIRTFATCATLASSSALGLVLIVSPVSWAVFRLIYGMCISGLYIVIESWLNSMAENNERGKILSVYMLISYVGVILGQGFIFTSSAAGFSLFALCSILLSLALVPVSISNSAQPVVVKDTERFGPLQLIRVSPLATFGCFCSGLILSAFWGFGPVFLLRLGFTANEAALFIGATLLGGLLLQWPLGILSDKINRRVAIGISSLLGILTAIFIVLVLHGGLTHMTPWLLVLAMGYGGGNYALYSLCIALMNDFLEQKHMVRASGGLLALHAVGAVIGPVLATVFIAMTDAWGMMLFSAVVGCVVFAVTVFQFFRGRTIPEATSDDFVAVPRTGWGILGLMKK